MVRLPSAVFDICFVGLSSRFRFFKCSKGDETFTPHQPIRVEDVLPLVRGHSSCVDIHGAPKARENPVAPQSPYHSRTNPGSVYHTDRDVHRTFILGVGVVCTCSVQVMDAAAGATLFYMFIIYRLSIHTCASAVNKLLVIDSGCHERQLKERGKAVGRGSKWASGLPLLFEERKCSRSVYRWKLSFAIRSNVCRQKMPFPDWYLRVCTTIFWKRCISLKTLLLVSWFHQFSPQGIENFHVWLQEQGQQASRMLSLAAGVSS